MDFFNNKEIEKKQQHINHNRFEELQPKEEK